MEGGRAIADVLLGDKEPGGRLPLAIPADARHLPAWDPSARRVLYDRWIGQRRLDHDGHPAAHPFGSGLGYTTFTVTALELDSAGDHPRARVRAENTGTRRGATIVQLYAFDAAARPQRREHRLVGFARVACGPGETVEASIDVDLGPVSTRDPVTRRWSARPGDWSVRAGLHAADATGPQLPLP
jgi:beta-glucosidase